MVFRKSLVVVAGLVMSLCASAWAGPAEEAAASKKSGDELLSKADFNGALKAYAAAAKTDSANQDYRMEYAVLRRVIAIREDIKKEKNSEKWQAAARSLHSYYSKHSLYSEALPLDRQLHEKLNNGDSAALLADTYLSMDKAADAEKVLAALPAAQVTADTQIILGIAQIRQGKTAEAKATAAKVKVPADATPGFLYNYACLQTRLDDKAGATASLTKCFEQTPPSRIQAMKDMARKDKDLTGVVNTPDFAKALKAESKVKESKCSGGSDCGSCSKKGSCTGGEKDKKSCPDHKETKATPEKK